MNLIVPAEPRHALSLSQRLREADLLEIAATHGATPEEALRRSCEASEACWTMLHNGRPEVIFGVAPWPGVAGVGQPWLLAAEVTPGWRGFFARHSREYVDRMLALYPTLLNYTDARHTESHRWLLWCGFDFLRIDPEHGVGRIPFILFGRTLHV